MKDRVLSIRIEEEKVPAFDAVAARYGVTRNELFGMLIDLALRETKADGWTCRTVRLDGDRIGHVGALDPLGEEGYSTEMALPDEAWAYLDGQGAR